MRQTTKTQRQETIVVFIEKAKSKKSFLVVVGVGDDDMTRVGRRAELRERLLASPVDVGCDADFVSRETTIEHAGVFEFALCFILFRPNLMFA